MPKCWYIYSVESGSKRKVVSVRSREIFKAQLSAYLRWPLSRRFPQGIYFIRDFKRFFPNTEMDIILDVGAHLGQSAVEYAINFPTARIECFEPVRQTFLELQRSTARYRGIRCHNVALGSFTGESRIDTTVSHSSMATISASGNEVIDLMTASEFCAANGIHHISFLKIDTEGFDLEVLRGAEALLDEVRVDFIQVEAGMNPENITHVYFEAFTSYLHAFGYRLFGIYEQSSETLTNSPTLRRSNLVFASPLSLDITGR